MNESLMEPTQRSIPVQKRALEKYELILKVSCELLEERGFAGMSTREISRRAGCNIATVYRWVNQGLRGVKLRTSFVGGHRRTCEAWLNEFFVGIEEAHDSKAHLANE